MTFTLAYIYVSELPPRRKLSVNDLLNLGLPQGLIVLIISASPLVELRGALPVAINIFHFPWYYALLLAIIGNLVPVPFLLLFFNAMPRLLGGIGFFDRFFHWLFARTKRKGRIIDRYKRIGLLLFVAIPLPGSGAWTGSLAAVLFGIEFKDALFSIFTGILIAGIIVTGLSLLGWAGAIITGTCLAGLAIYSLWKN